MIYWGALYGGSITSILFNIPGEPWAVAATFDGYPMAKGGRPGKALVLSFLAHGVGALFGCIVLTFFSPILAEFALKFGPAEVFAVMMLTFSAFVGLGGKSPLKTVVAILFGFILAAVGMDIVSGQLRMTYGTVVLMGGFNFIVAVIGLFGSGRDISHRRGRTEGGGDIDKDRLEGHLGRGEGCHPLSEGPHYRNARRRLDGVQAGGRNARFVHGLWFYQAVQCECR